MADSHQMHAYQAHALRAEMARLRRAQLAATDSANYVGWKRQERAAYDERANRMEGLLRELARLDPSP